LAVVPETVAVAKVVPPMAGALFKVIPDCVQLFVVACAAMVIEGSVVAFWSPVSSRMALVIVPWPARLNSR